jgi:hypothetical protein
MLLARIISRSFNPLVITFYYLLVTLNLNTQIVPAIPEKAKWMLLGMVIITTWFVPGMLMALFETFFNKALKFKENERKIFSLLITAIFYFLTYYLLNQIQLSPIYTLFLLGSSTLIGISILITLFWNISIYMVAMGAFTGALMGISLIFNLNLMFYILLVIIISGLTGYSRLALGEHRPAEVYGGFLLGATGLLLHYLYV